MQFFVYFLQIDNRFGFGGVDVVGDIEVVVVFFNFFYVYVVGVVFYFIWMIDVGINDFLDVVGFIVFICLEIVLVFGFVVVFVGVDEEYVVFFFVFFQYQNINGDVCREKQIGW